jgi:hypothetical protein
MAVSARPSVPAELGEIPAIERDTTACLGIARLLIAAEFDLAVRAWALLKPGARRGGAQGARQSD